MKRTAVAIAKIWAVLLLAMLSASPAGAAGLEKSISKTAPLTQAYVWYDGDRERQVWLNPAMVAEFNPDTQGANSVRSVYAAAQVVSMKRAQAGVRLWKLGGNSADLIRSLRTVHPQGRYSSVFHDGPDSNARMRALPGNIIVYLDPQWNPAQVSGWLAAHKLEVVKQLEIGPNVYVIKTAPGLEALTIANALYRSGDVKAAFPDWWQEVVTR